MHIKNKYNKNSMFFQIKIYMSMLKKTILVWIHIDKERYWMRYIIQMQPKLLTQYRIENMMANFIKYKKNYNKS